MNTKEINLIKLKDIKLNNLINRKNEDRMSLVDFIISKEKKINKEKITNEWINNRWFELKTMDYKNLLDIYINNKLSKLTPKQIKKEIELDTYANKIIKIYDKLFNKKNSQHNTVESINKQIIELEKRNIDIEKINVELIEYIRFNHYTISNMIEYLHNIYVFFKPELINKYIIICYLDYDEINYYKSNIIGNITSINLKNENLNINDIEKVINLDNDKFIGSENLYDHKFSIKKTMNHIKSKFPEGTKFVLVNL